MTPMLQGLIADARRRAEQIESTPPASDTSEARALHLKSQESARQLREWAFLLSAQTHNRRASDERQGVHRERAASRRAARA